MLIKKILYAFIGILLGVVAYLFLLSNIPITEAVNITVQKPIIESTSIVVEGEENNIEKLIVLNQNFKPEYDAKGNLVPHPSGFDYVYDEDKNAVGLIDKTHLANIGIDIEYAEDSTVLPHESGNPFVYNSNGVPVGLMVADVVSYGNVEANYNESTAILANSYYLNHEDIKYYESMDVVKFGQENPMWHEVREKVVEEAIEDKENIPPIIYDEIEELEIAADETVGYDTNVGDLKIVNVGDIESRIQAEGKLPVDRKYYNITSSFGPRRDPFIGDERFHVGLDIAENGIAGRYVYSVLNGTIEVLSYNNSLGNYIVVSHGSFNTVYAHLEAFSKGLKVGDEVLAGSEIAYVGNTGRSTGPHLHIEFDIKGIKLNPERFLDKIAQ